MSPVHVTSLSILASLIACLTACADADEVGRYAVTWSLARNGQPTTCGQQQVVDMRISTVDMATSDTRMWSVPCADGMAVLADVPLGQHRVQVEGLGVQGDFAGAAEVSGALQEVGQITTLPPFTVPVLPPETVFVPRWHVLYRSQPSTCVNLGATGVQIKTQPDGRIQYTDIYDCIDFGGRIDLPLLPFTGKAELLGAGNRVIASTDLIRYGATRGEVHEDFAINVP